MRKLDFFRLLAPKCASTAAGAGSLKKSNFLTFSKVLRIGPDQANTILAQILYHALLVDKHKIEIEIFNNFWYLELGFGPT